MLNLRAGLGGCSSHQPVLLFQGEDNKLRVVTARA